MGSVFNGPERRSPRVAASIPVRLLLNGDNTKPGQSAHTVDLSDRGVRIRTHSTLSQGDVIRIDSWGATASPCRRAWFGWSLHPPVSTSQGWNSKVSPKRSVAAPAFAIDET